MNSVHEAGHWFGLLHVFQATASNPPEAGGCQGAGDAVEDTPAQRGPGSVCEQTDSCPGKPGLDNIHNYMDYTVDECRYEFTEGQEARMHNMYNALRKGV